MFQFKSPNLNKIPSNLTLMIRIKSKISSIWSIVIQIKRKISWILNNVLYHNLPIYRYYLVCAIPCESKNIKNVDQTHDMAELLLESWNHTFYITLHFSQTLAEKRLFANKKDHISRYSIRPLGLVQNSVDLFSRDLFLSHNAHCYFV